MTIMSAAPDVAISLDQSDAAHFRGLVPGARSGIRRIDVIVRHISSGEHLQPDGTMGDWTILCVQPCFETPDGASWTLPPSSVPNGDYYVQSRRVANDGHRSPWRRHDQEV